MLQHIACGRFLPDVSRSGRHIRHDGPGLSASGGSAAALSCADVAPAQDADVNRDVGQRDDSRVGVSPSGGFAEAVASPPVPSATVCKDQQGQCDGSRAGASPSRGFTGAALPPPEPSTSTSPSSVALVATRTSHAAPVVLARSSSTPIASSASSCPSSPRTLSPASPSEVSDNSDGEPQILPAGAIINLRRGLMHIKLPFENRCACGIPMPAQFEAVTRWPKEPKLCTRCF